MTDLLGIVLGSAAAIVVAVLYVMRHQERASYRRSMVDPAALARETSGHFSRTGEKLSLFGKVQARACELAVIGTETAPEISVRVAAASPFTILSYCHT